MSSAFGYSPPPQILKSKRYTTSGTFNPTSNGQGRTMFSIFYCGGGGAGSGGGIGGAGAAQLLQTDWVTITAPVVVTVGAGGTGVSDASGNNGGSSTIIGGGISLISYGGLGMVDSDTPGKSYIMGLESLGTVCVTGGKNNGGTPGQGIGRAMINPSGYVTISSLNYFVGGIPLTYVTSSGGPGFECTASNTGYGTGAHQQNTNPGTAGRQGIVIFYWQ